MNHGGGGLSAFLLCSELSNRFVLTCKSVSGFRHGGVQVPYDLHWLGALYALHRNLAEISETHTATVVGMFHLLTHEEKHVVFAIAISLGFATALAHSVLRLPVEELTVLGIVLVGRHRTLFAFLDNVHVHRLELDVLQALNAFARRRFPLYGGEAQRGLNLCLGIDAMQTKRVPCLIDRIVRFLGRRTSVSQIIDHLMQLLYE